MKPEIIEALKENEKPFGLMSEELQEALLATEEKDILIYHGAGKWKPISLPPVKTYEDYKTWSFCLRPDYEPESEIVECEIFEDGGQLGFDGKCGIQGCSISEAYSIPDFIGFKFEDNGTYATPVKYKDSKVSKTVAGTNLHNIVSGEVEVLHATHVLFRRPK